MSSSQFRIRWLFAALLMSLLGATALADDPLVYATIQPAQIYLGESAQFTITNLGDGTNPITLPAVSGLKFEIVARTHEIQIINGSTLPSSSTVMRVTPQIAGIFTIPAVTPKSQPLVLQVNAAPSGAYVPRADTRARPPPPILSGGPLPKGVRLTDDGSAYVRLSIPKREIYIGESIPVEIEVGMRSGFVSSLNGLPKLAGDNFTLNNLSRQPERNEKLINGEPFVLFTWRSILSVVKPGTFSLSAEAPMTVKIRTRSRRDALLDDRFGDPFYQNLFGTTIPKDVDVTSPPQELKVMELPAEGRPADFHGAIGTFNVVSDISPAKADVGDPMTLRLRITGSGSFDRVDSTMLDHVDQWKTYPPKSSFNTSDPIGFSGMKTFEQPVIASKPGAQTLPALSFSYFDPNTRRYETARSTPLNVAIAPSLADSTLTASQVAANAAASGALKSPVGLRPDHLGDEASTPYLTPLYLQPRFLAIPSFLVLAFAAGWVGVRRRRDEESRSIMQAMAQMEAAARAGNEMLFFDSARGALQRLFAAQWQLLPAEVTTAEIDTRMGGDNEVHRLFALADESKYSGRAPDATDFVRWLRVVRDRLAGEKSA
jgi:hypothetical protein